ncbi:MAG: hypothetical protein Q7T44_15435 [Parvibaculum sp.]|nr:hypothetical protein [Parvibaculum sp.]
MNSFFAHRTVRRLAIALSLSASILVSGCSDESSNDNSAAQRHNYENPDVYAFIDPQYAYLEVDSLSALFSINLRIAKINDDESITDTGTLMITCKRNRPQQVSLFLPLPNLIEFNYPVTDDADRKYKALVSIPEASFEYRNFVIVSSHADERQSLITIYVWDMISRISQAIYDGHTLRFEVHPKAGNSTNPELRVSVMTSAPNEHTAELKSKVAQLYRACELLSYK